MAKILIIEDHADLRDDVIETLKLEGYETFGADNGTEGIEIAEREIPDLIVCDIMMPEMDGYEVLEHLRKQPKTAMIPFIFITARVERVSRRQGMVMGADDYLTKPFQVSDLLASIETQLRRRVEFEEIVNKDVDGLIENMMTALPHEFRTPLNTLLGFSDMLISEADYVSPEQVKLWGGHINDAAKRLHRLVENYLYYIRLQVMARTAEPAPVDDLETVFDLGGIAHEEAWRIAQEQNRVEDLDLALDPSAPFSLPQQDASKIIAEVVDNAFKFSKSGQVVSVKGTASGDEYQLVIKDEGVGLPTEMVKKIGAYRQFERWILEQQGMGLGLSIVKLLAELYNFDCKIQGEKGVGTTVTLTFDTSR